MTQHFFCNSMPVGEIHGDVAIVRFLIANPFDHGAPTGMDGIFTPHAARAAAEVLTHLADEMEKRHANPPPVARYRKPFL